MHDLCTKIKALYLLRQYDRANGTHHFSEYLHNERRGVILKLIEWRLRLRLWRLRLMRRTSETAAVVKSSILDTIHRQTDTNTNGEGKRRAFAGVFALSGTNVPPTPKQGKKTSVIWRFQRTNKERSRRNYSTDHIFTGIRRAFYAYIQQIAPYF